MMNNTRLTLVLSTSLLLIACGSGGTGDIDLVGTRSEDPGAKSGYAKYGAGSVTPTNRVGTLVALCVEACAHLRAADCTASPASGAGECPSLCKSSQGDVAPSKDATCDDERAAYLQCVIDNPVKCSPIGKPTVPCTDALTTLADCNTGESSSPYPSCTHQSSMDVAMCSYFGTSSHYYTCVSPPSGSCTLVASMGYCCP